MTRFFWWLGLSGNVLRRTDDVGHSDDASPAVSQMVVDRPMPTAGLSPAASSTTPTSAASIAFTVALFAATTTARYGYAEHTDSPALSLDVADNVTEQYVALPGKTRYVHRPAGGLYSHANIHGDTVAVTDASGGRAWSGYTRPYGETANGSTPPNSTVPNTSWGYLGDEQRLTDGPIIHMGARPYNPELGRFLTVDPVEGGCANDYMYVRGDPINKTDPSGRFSVCDNRYIRDTVSLFSILPGGEGRNFPGSLSAAGWVTSKYGQQFLKHHGTPRLMRIVTLAKKASFWATVAGTVTDWGLRIVCDG